VKKTSIVRYNLKVKSIYTYNLNQNQNNFNQNQILIKTFIRNLYT